MNGPISLRITLGSRLDEASAALRERCEPVVTRVCGELGLATPPAVDIGVDGSEPTARFAIGGRLLPISARRWQQAITTGTGCWPSAPRPARPADLLASAAPAGDAQAAVVTAALEHALFAGLGDVYELCLKDEDLLALGGPDTDTAALAPVAVTIAHWGISPPAVLASRSQPADSVSDPVIVAHDRVANAPPDLARVNLRGNAATLERLTTLPEPWGHRQASVISDLGSCVGYDIPTGIDVDDELETDHVNATVAGRTTPTRLVLPAGAVADFERPITGEWVPDPGTGEPVAINDAGVWHDVLRPIDLALRQVEMDCHLAAALWSSAALSWGWQSMPNRAEVLGRLLARERATTRYVSLLPPSTLDEGGSIVEQYTRARLEIGSGCITTWPLQPGVVIERLDQMPAEDVSAARNWLLAEYPGLIERQCGTIVVAPDVHRVTVAEALRPLADSVIVTCPGELAGSVVGEVESVSC